LVLKISGQNQVTVSMPKETSTRDDNDSYSTFLRIQYTPLERLLKKPWDGGLVASPTAYSMAVAQMDLGDRCPHHFPTVFTINPFPSPLFLCPLSLLLSRRRVCYMFGRFCVSVVDQIYML
jgi:hypothetical protein